MNIIIEGEGEMKKANCILCDHDAKRGVYSGSKEPTKDAGGFKYK